VAGKQISHSESFRAGVARLSFVVPASAAHKLLKVKVRIQEGGQSATRVSTFLVRDAASFALPFCRPDGFAALWQRIVASLAPGGRFCGQLFGDRDEWASPPLVSRKSWSSPPAMSFHSRDEVLALLRGLEIEHLDEVDEDGQTAVGDPKHWHVFHVVARKR